MNMDVLMPVALMAILGGLLGLVLAYASRKFFVAVDPRVEAVQNVLPGANCGACGSAGCAGYAEAIVNKGAALTLCAPGGAKVRAAIAQVMGQTVTAVEPNFAVVRCDGDGVQPRFHYSGVQSCKAASVMGLAGSFQDCPYGCLGLGSCVEACPFGALSLNAQNIAVVDETLCSGCGKCVESCPRGLIRIDAESRVVVVRCNNRDKGAKANKQCNHACIACGKCVRECPFDAIHVVDNVAVIDYEKCKLCGKCVKACPKHLIVDIRQQRKENKQRREAEFAAEEGGTQPADAAGGATGGVEG